MSARERARLNQPVCSLEGMCSLLQATPGDLAVIIHGDPGCAGVLVQTMDLPGAERFFVTGIDEQAAVAGASRARLEACLAAVCGTGPGVVFVLGTCLGHLLGDDIRAAADRASAPPGTRVVALPGTSLRPVDPATLVDRFARLLAPTRREGPRDEGAINLVGFDPGKAVREELARLGVRVNACLDRGTPLHVWQDLGRAGINVVLDRALFAGFLSEAETRLGQRTCEVPWPVGYSATLAFYQAICRATGTGRDPREILADEAMAARRLVETRPGAGLRLGYNLGSLKNLEPRSLAREGLCDLPFFEELGFEPVLLVQGDDRPARARAVTASLREKGCEAPVRYFADTVRFGACCKEAGVALACASDHLREEASRVGVPLLPAGSPAPGFGGVRPNLRQLERLLRHGGRP